MRVFLTEGSKVERCGLLNTERAKTPPLLFLKTFIFSYDAARAALRQGRHHRHGPTFGSAAFRFPEIPFNGFMPPLKALFLLYVSSVVRLPTGYDCRPLVRWMIDKLLSHNKLKDRSVKGSILISVRVSEFCRSGRAADLA